MSAIANVVDQVVADEVVVDQVVVENTDVKVKKPKMTAEEKAQKLAEKDAKKLAKVAEKAQKLAEKEAKEAEKAQKLAEKEAEKAKKLAEKEAEKAKKLAEKEAKKNAEKLKCFNMELNVHCFISKDGSLYQYDQNKNELTLVGNYNTETKEVNLTLQLVNFVVGETIC